MGHHFSSPKNRNRPCMPVHREEESTTLLEHLSTTTPPRHTQDTNTHLWHMHHDQLYLATAPFCVLSKLVLLPPINWNLHVPPLSLSLSILLPFPPPSDRGRVVFHPRPPGGTIGPAAPDMGDLSPLFWRAHYIQKTKWWYWNLNTSSSSRWYGDDDDGDDKITPTARGVVARNERKVK